MNKDLLIRLLGKEDAVKFDDEMYNLRSIVEDLRPHVILKSSLTEEETNTVLAKLLLTNVFIGCLSKNLESITGYTNTKSYFTGYLNGLHLHINEICSALKNNDINDLTYHTNCLADLVYKY